MLTLLYIVGGGHLAISILVYIYIVICEVISYRKITYNKFPVNLIDSHIMYGIISLAWPMLCYMTAVEYTTKVIRYAKSIRG